VSPGVVPSLAIMSADAVPSGRAPPPSGDPRPAARPSLSLVVPTRHRWSSVAPLVTEVLPELREAQGELLVVGLGGGSPSSTPAGVRVISVPDPDLVRLRLRAVQEARGSIVAIGEDHSVPAPGWCSAVLRAHAEHPDAVAIIGCLVNGATDSVAGRANFLAFAGPYAPPMPDLPGWRPPPLSTVSLKRGVLEALGDHPSTLDSLVSSLFTQGRMVADDRIVQRHVQDLGVAGSIRNAFEVTRASYGYAPDRHQPGRRYEVVRWVVRHLPRMVWRAARETQPPTRSRWAELAIVAAIAGANTTGAVVGALSGHGRAGEHYE
jgi:hypothetical protein